MAPLALSPWLLQNTSTVPSFFMTQVNEQPNYEQAAAYLSAKILTIGGVVLFFLGLCCIGAVLMRFNCQQQHEMQRIEFIKDYVLDQNAIHRSIPFRIWPSHQQFIMDSNNQIVIYVQRIPKKSSSSNCSSKEENTSAKGGESGSSGSRNMSKTIRKGLGFVEKWRYCSTSSSSSVSGSKSVSSITQDSYIPMIDLVGGNSQELSLESQSRRGSLTGSIAEEASCSICLCEYVNDDRIRILPCTHEYHAECIDIWLTNKSTQCPLCKHDLVDDLALPSPSSRRSASS